MKIGVIDYGSGNVGSVMNSLNRLGHSPVLSREFLELVSCTHLILPGVGSFGAVKARLDSVLSAKEVISLTQSSKAFLGICVGMQILCDLGEEDQITQGFGLFSGRVARIPNAKVVPHMGWNNLQGIRSSSPLLEGISEEDDFYFVHSYCLTEENSSQVVARADYGSAFPAVTQNGSVYGVQFHPEKSAAAGRKLLTNFLSL